MNQPKRTCYELGVCQQRTPPCRGCEPLQMPVKPPATQKPAAPRTAWAFQVSFEGLDLLAAVGLVAVCYFCAGYFG